MSRSSTFESPAPVRSTLKKRKRRPTRTPKPLSPGRSRLYSPSPFLDRSSFKRKQLLSQTRVVSSSSASGSPSDPSSDESDLDGSYDLSHELSVCYSDRENEDTTNQSFVGEHKSSTTQSPPKSSSSITMGRKPSSSKSSSPQTKDLACDLSNLSLISPGSPAILRNARASIKSSSVQTPKMMQAYGSSKIKKRTHTQPEKADMTIQNQAKRQSASSTVRITKSHRVFNRYHTFKKLLVPVAECGSGCPLYRSQWRETESITKLMPLYGDDEFTPEENVDNALREYELHASVYRHSCKAYGSELCPVVALYGCVTLQQHNKPYLAFVMPALHCNLAQFVQKYRKLTVAEGRMLLATGLRLLKSMKALHLIHNDLKPENLFLEVTFDSRKKPHVKKFVFGDYGCAALTTEDFPFGSLTGTITMWDVEALGKKHGDENGFSFENDLYGFIGTLLDGVYGACMLEELLEEEDPQWEDTEWSEYSDLIRVCRARMNNVQFMRNELKGMKLEDKILDIVLLQLGETRKNRMTLQQVLDLVQI